MRSTLQRTVAIMSAVLLVLSIGSVAVAKAPNVPGYHIVSVVAVSAGADSVGCAVDVTAIFKLPKRSDATYLRFIQTTLPGGSASIPTPAIERANRVESSPPAARAWGVKWELTQRFAEVRLDDAGLSWTWGAQLLSGYWDGDWHTEPLTIAATSLPFTGTDAICPAAGTIVGTYPIYP